MIFEFRLLVYAEAMREGHLKTNHSTVVFINFIYKYTYLLLLINGFQAGISLGTFEYSFESHIHACLKSY